MIVNSFLPVPRMDHVLLPGYILYQYDRCLYFRFFYGEFSVHCCCMILYQVGNIIIWTYHSNVRDNSSIRTIFSCVAPLCCKKLGNILKGPRPAYLYLCTRKRNTPFYEVSPSLFLIAVTHPMNTRHTLVYTLGYPGTKPGCYGHSLVGTSVPNLVILVIF